MSGTRELPDATAPVVTGADLGAASRAPAVPFRIALRDPDALLTCDRVLRVLPGRRLVVRAWLYEAPVLLKLFFGPGADRHAAREADGSARLAAAEVPAPALLHRAATADGKGRALLFEFLEGVRPIDVNDTAGLAAAAVALARLHATGCVHTDLHFDNLLVDAPGGRGLRLVDADGVRRAAAARMRRSGLSRRASLRNLAVLCAQRPLEMDADLGPILRAYLAARGWRDGAAGCDLAALRAATRRARDSRIRRYLRKTERPCSEYLVERVAGAMRFAVRDAVGPALREFFADPETTMQRGVMLKDGNSATVVRTVLGERTWIVKRYNVKGLGHRMRRSLHWRARYRNAWRQGQLLHFAGVPTARPVALLERRRGLLRDVAYLVMEDLGDLDLRSGLPDDALVEGIVGLFCAMDALQLEHGDTKATNFLRTDAGVAVIDLDAMTRRPLARRRLMRDRARFLANWNDRPALRERFAAAFGAAGLGA